MPPIPTGKSEKILLAPYAFHCVSSRGRRYPEAAHPYRGPFQRDRDRIIHCAAFRRLSEKMQVFTAEFGHYHRTRLTHTMEVVSIARTLGRALALNEELIEAAALLHDVGHPPFGHAGEKILDDLLKNEGGFNHNGQALRIAEKLERRYADFPGLNLSWEILDGQAFKIGKKGSPLLEIQVVDMADSIAYDTHDVDDAMEMGLLQPEDCLGTSLWKLSATKIRKRWQNLDDDLFRQLMIRDLIDIQVSDILAATQNRIRTANLSSSEEARTVPILVAPSAEMAEQKGKAEAFLFQKVYRHPKVMRHRSRICSWIEGIFEFYRQHAELLPRRYAPILSAEGTDRAVADFIADQTDRSARAEALRTQHDQPRSPIEAVL